MTGGKNWKGTSMKFRHLFFLDASLPGPFALFFSSWEQLLMLLTVHGQHISFYIFVSIQENSLGSLVGSHSNSRLIREGLIGPA